MSPVDLQGLSKVVAQIWAWVEAIGGFMKITELVLLLATLMISMMAGYRIKKAAKELKATIEDSVQLLETKVQAVKGQVAELADTQNDQFVTALDVPPTQAITEASLDHWHQVRESWSDTRSRIEQLVWSISDGRVRRKYSTLDWRQYSKLLDLMRSDKILSAEAHDAVVELQRMFNALKLRKANVTATDAETARQLATRIGRLTEAASGMDDSRTLVGTAERLQTAAAVAR